MTRKRLRSPEAIARVLDTRRSRFLYPYMGMERSVSQAAGVLGVSIARMAYQTARLVEVGLVDVVRTEPRAGRSVVFYRSTADEYVIALADAGVDDFEQFELDAEDPLRRAFARGLLLAMARRRDAESLAIRFRRLEDGSMDVSPGRLDGADIDFPGWTSWTTVLLSEDDATALAIELEELWQRWRKRHTAGGLPHLLRLGLAPLPQFASRRDRD